MECAPVTRMKFVRSWRVYRAGQVVEIPGGLAAELASKRIAVEDHQGTLIETAAMEPVAETADATPQRRGKRGVRKPHPDNAAGS